MELQKVSFIAPYDVLLLKFFGQNLEVFSLPNFILARLTFMTQGKNLTSNFANEMS